VDVDVSVVVAAKEENKRRKYSCRSFTWSILSV
jgi:hypothetical protein